MLAEHVLAHYDKFLEGVAAISTFEHELDVRISLFVSDLASLLSPGLHGEGHPSRSKYFWPQRGHISPA